MSPPIDAPEPNDDTPSLPAGDGEARTEALLIAPGTRAAVTSHPRTYQENKFVYPVLSRRSRGISVGVNLNPDKICNFDCVYCQVDRRSAGVTLFVETGRLLDELEHTLDLVATGSLYSAPPFESVPEELRRLNDIAFSGDGEPTSFRNFDAIAADVAAIKRRRGLDTVKMVLITNASLFHRPHVKNALATFDRNQGEIWAKLDAGTAEYFRQIDRTPIPFDRILRNIHEAAQVRPLVIQSLFMKIDGQGPSIDEIAAFCDRLRDVVQGGGQIDRVQVYTVARRPAESFVAPLGPTQIDAIADAVRARVGVTVEAYHQ
jgi:wyosine [tRNA(Phe)-imidazoG37] synthetase (radical SAM superfamily)